MEDVAGPMPTVATTSFGSQELLGLEQLVDQIKAFHQRLMRALLLRK
jgi:hypothetical protein